MAEQYSWDKALQEHYYVGSYSGIAGNIPNITRASIADGKVLNNLVFLPYSGKDNYLLDSLNSTYSECSSFSGHLHDEIIMINTRADVVDVVGTHEAFTTRSASMVPGVDITHRDVIKILNDVGDDIPVWVLQGDTHAASSVSPAHQQTYYRWLSAVNNTTSGWEYVGDLEPYYSNIVANDNNQLLTFTNTNSDRNYNISAGSGVGFVVNERTVTISAQDGKISWVKYNQGSQTPEVKRSGLSVVTSEQGTRIQNDDATEKFYVAPNFSTPADTGKVFTIDNDGAAKWKQIPTPEKDLVLQMYKDDLLDIGSNTSILKKIYIPEGTTKLEGSFNCYPNTDYESISIVLLKADGREYETSQNLNFDHLLALNDTGSSGSRGQYSNTLNFKFKRNRWNDPFHSLAIKGQSGTDLSNYHINNIQIMFYKERSDELSSLNSVNNSENNSEHDSEND